ncbi:DUF5977 domain-containing protein [Spirosoma sp.]|uniref:DUF5977 domain-containing protein n=1 Tax=Spirosoma sp. TaxID=1899569 RepID=UPI00262F82E2|nr:DUF5977 domain-containing protein [Spirosoma sp.]MCX6216413.1 DUF5977 domain-containing protein [Spirosoma sp.]
MDPLLQTLSFLPLRFSRNPIAYTIDAAPDSIPERQNLSYLLTLKKPRSYGSGEYNTLITLPGREFPPRAELGATVYPGAQFDVSVFIDDLLLRTPPTPTQTGFVACVDMITPYLTQTRVENAGVLLAGTNQTLPLEYALKGALSVEQFAGWRDQFFTTYLSQSRQFLTWQPAQKWVETNQPEFLYYLVNFSPKPSELRLRVAIQYTDGSSDLLTGLSLTTVSQYTVYSIPVGFQALGLAAREELTSKTVQSYQVWVSSETNARLSEIRTYHVNRDYEPNTLYLLFANSLGGYDTLRCTGQTSRNLTVKGTAAQRALLADYLPTSAELFSRDRKGEKVLVANTGLLDGELLDYLSELSLSDEIYVATQEGFVALVPSDNTLNLRTDDEDLAGRTFTFTHAKMEIGYSALPMAPVTELRATRWVPINTFCLINENGVRTGLIGAAQLELHYADDGSLVKPRQIKANVPGTDGYQTPVTTSACAPATTPFLNSAISRTGTYIRNNCPASQYGGYATLSIPAGTYGAQTAEQLQARIDTALVNMDTQAYANANGPCLLNPYDYVVSVPAGSFRFRTNAPEYITVFYDGSPTAGNAWQLDRPQANVYPYAQNDLELPIGANPSLWMLMVRAPGAGSNRIRVYRNGVLVSTRTDIPFNSDLGKPMLGAGLQVASGDRIYIDITVLTRYW